ncbi:hypothetical protein A2215_02690 [Candidatus Berkelbacteria bacterium RIFOXYA2_FULL_43_10]|uniref:Uncharacterized protein n=1 Tax=Candidatus Berkelbacteria bacterium RIFOXYA2_FULL_43_10 TaxID=1797472 RepID=A0A1F5EEA7_9BACT|nr:MAG: hypothetical protein A2215_02690 [Candidatus Berkelbacteria bacterium RIFOXYA2_FULL_43_10]
MAPKARRKARPITAFEGQFKEAVRSLDGDPAGCEVLEVAAKDVKVMAQFQWIDGLDEDSVIVVTWLPRRARSKRLAGILNVKLASCAQELTRRTRPTNRSEVTAMATQLVETDEQVAGRWRPPLRRTGHSHCGCR